MRGQWPPAGCGTQHWAPVRAAGGAASRVAYRSQEGGREARVAPVPPAIRLSVLRRWAPRVARALLCPPRLLERTGSRRPSYVSGPVCWDILSRGPDNNYIETASMFVRRKVGKCELRVIVDARNVNERDPGWERLGPRMPSVDDVGHLLKGRRYATTSNFRNYFSSIPIGARLQKFFYIPRLRRFVSRLPMGWTRAPDLAAAVTESVVGGDLANTQICIDNVLVAERRREAVAEAALRIDERIRRLGIT